MGVMSAATLGWGADSSDTNASDPLLDLFIKKGFVTQKEAEQVEAEAEALRANESQMPPAPLSRWKISQGIKSVQFFGDIRLRYEDREAQDPGGDKIDLQRFRYAVRVGLRGDLVDNLYYGFRVETVRESALLVRYLGHRLRSVEQQSGVPRTLRQIHGEPRRRPDLSRLAAVGLGGYHAGKNAQSALHHAAGLERKHQSGRRSGAIQVHRGQCGFLCHFRPVPLPGYESGFRHAGSWMSTDLRTTKIYSCSPSRPA